MSTSFGSIHLLLAVAQFQHSETLSEQFTILHYALQVRKISMGSLVLRQYIVHLIKLSLIDCYRHQYHERVAQNLDDIVELLQQLLARERVDSIAQSGVGTEVPEEAIKCFQVRHQIPLRAWVQMPIYIRPYGGP